MKGIIFDLDGVIALTEDLHYEAFHFAFAGYGVNIDRKLWDKEYVGKGHRFIINSVFGKSPANDRFIDKWVTYYQRVAHRAKPVPGVIDYINSLTIPSVVATGSTKKSAYIVLDSLNISLPLISMEDHPKPKPDPGLFLLAAKKIEVQPEDCLVFEDSPFGVEAAIRAGMQVIALLTTHSRESLKEANRIIDDFTELLTDQSMNDWQRYLAK